MSEGGVTVVIYVEEPYGFEPSMTVTNSRDEPMRSMAHWHFEPDGADNPGERRPAGVEALAAPVLLALTRLIEHDQILAYGWVRSHPAEPEGKLEVLTSISPESVEALCRNQDRFSLCLVRTLTTGPANRMLPDRSSSVSAPSVVARMGNLDDFYQRPPDGTLAMLRFMAWNAEVPVVYLDPLISIDWECLLQTAFPESRLERLDDLAALYGITPGDVG